MDHKLKKSYAFTLVELLVAMAIISVLIGLGVGAVSVAQQTARDAERRDKAKEAEAAILQFYQARGYMPNRNATGTNGISVQGGGSRLEVGSVVDITLSGATLGADIANDETTNAQATRYCYNHNQGGAGSSGNEFIFGTLLENNNWFYTGTNQDLECGNTTSLRRN